MTKESDLFEQQIARIHRLIESEDAKVEWNDSIDDPDNPGQPRQIDIHITKEDYSTHIECRIHKNPQGVKWIEELIGRKISLKADCMIAVSASGYTEGAIKKAKAYGIIIYELQNLTDEEIKLWGGKTNILLRFNKYEDIEFCFFIDRKGKPLPGGFIQRLSEYFSKCCFNDLFDRLREEIEEAIENYKKKVYLFEVEFSLNEPYKEDEIISNKVLIKGKALRIEKEVFIPSIMIYDTPEYSFQKRIKIEIGEDQCLEIYHSDNKNVIYFVLSNFELPQNFQFLGAVIGNLKTDRYYNIIVKGIPKNGLGPNLTNVIISSLS